MGCSWTAAAPASCTHHVAVVLKHQLSSIWLQSPLYVSCCWWDCSGGMCQQVGFGRLLFVHNDNYALVSLSDLVELVPQHLLFASISNEERGITQIAHTHTQSCAFTKCYSWQELLPPAYQVWLLSVSIAAGLIAQAQLDLVVVVNIIMRSPTMH
jgi:hypothetical protein